MIDPGQLWAQICHLTGLIANLDIGSALQNLITDFPEQVLPYAAVTVDSLIGSWESMASTADDEMQDQMSALFEAISEFVQALDSQTMQTVIERILLFVTEAWTAFPDSLNVVDFIKTAVDCCRRATSFYPAMGNVLSLCESYLQADR
jgi:hypothetical protein